jgi:NAD(P)-dependent dehydrogenase (short-subunit alcohol dehydrogenase family)
LVTSGARGIGLAAVRAFHDLGAIVAVNGRTAAEVDQAIHSLGASRRLIAAPGDITATDDRQRVINTVLFGFEGLDILINCPGCFETAGSSDLTESHWQRMIDANVKAGFFVIQGFLDALKQSRGSIVNVASAIGLLAEPRGTLARSAANGAVIQMTRMLALHLAKEGVRVNALCPGWLESTESASLADVHAIAPSAADKLSQSTPVGRAGTLDECVGSILYLAGPFSGFTTASVLTADGGLSAGH